MKVEVNNPAVEFHDMTVSYDRKPVLWNIDMTLPKGALIKFVPLFAIVSNKNTQSNKERK